MFAGPHHPYTEALLSGGPDLDDTDRVRIRLEGDIPSAADPPTGCPFHTRCPRKIGEICETTEPELRQGGRARDPLSHPAGGAAPAPDGGLSAHRRERPSSRLSGPAALGH